MKTSTVVVLLLAGSLIGALMVGVFGALMFTMSKSSPSAYAEMAPSPSVAAMPMEMPMDEAKAAEGGLGMIGSGPGGGGRKRMLHGKGGGGLGALGDGFGSGAGAMPSAPPMAMKKPAPDMDKDDVADEEDRKESSGGEGDEGGAPTRAWFPETFLFEPLVVTDNVGHATVPVKVPDRLTSWRVLALAHSREGAQAGAVTSFLGTLPTYVDPVVPPSLVAGDEVKLPVQVVNTTENDVSTSLKLSATGAVLASTGGPLKVAAAGNQTQFVTMKVPRAGTATLKAVLGGTDAVERAIEVKPAGMLQTVNAGGTLAAPRSLELDGPAQAIEGSEKVRLQVYPGALALLRAELSAAPGRGGVAEDAYTLMLAGRASALLTSLGATPDANAIRDVTVLAGQRAIRAGRSPDVPTAVLFAEAAAPHTDNPVLARLAERLAAQVAQAQRPDGTCEGATGWTLQRLLVTTGECVRAVRASTSSPAAKARANGVSIKAAGAFERNLARIDDGYTAAAALASGAVSGTVAEALKAKVLENLETRADGAQVLKVGTGVVRPDGLPPSTMEATALAVLALEGDPKAPLADLGTALLGGYSPLYGWGDGRANLVALRAVTTLFKDKVPGQVKIVLERDGREVVSGLLDPTKLQDVLSLEADAPGSGGAHTWQVRAEPSVAGLGYSLTLQAHVPWKEDGVEAGLELQVAAPKSFEVGRASDLQVTAAAPAGMATKLTIALPAGVQADRPPLDTLVSQGRLARYETEDGAVILHLPAQSAGASFSAAVRVVPTLAGTLHAAANTLSLEGLPSRSRAFTPMTWQVK